MAQQKTKSIERIVAFGKKYDLATLAIVVNAKQNNDIKLINQMLGKNLKKSSAIGQARLAEQYIRMVSAPTPQQKRVVESKVGIKLTKNPKQNFEEFEQYRKTFPTTKKFQKPKKIKVKVGKSIPLTILPPTFSSVNKTRYFQATKDFPTVVNLNGMLKQYEFSSAQRQALKTQGIHKMRLFLRLETDGKPYVISTSVLNIGNTKDLKAFLAKYSIGSVVSGKTYYKYDLDGFYEQVSDSFKVIGVEQAWVNFYKGVKV